MDSSPLTGTVWSPVEVLRLLCDLLDVRGLSILWGDSSVLERLVFIFRLYVWFSGSGQPRKWIRKSSQTNFNSYHIIFCIVCCCTFFFGVCMTYSVMYSGCSSSRVTRMKVTQKVCHRPETLSSESRRVRTLPWWHYLFHGKTLHPLYLLSLSLSRSKISVTREQQCAEKEEIDGVPNAAQKEMQAFLLSTVQPDWSAVTFLLMPSEFTWQKVNVCAWLPTIVCERDLFS